MDPEVQETQDLDVAEAVEQVEEPVTEDAEPSLDVSIEDKWDSLDLTSVLSDPEAEADTTDDATAESKDDAAFPSDGDQIDADDMEQELTDEQLLELNLDKPAPLSRRKAQKVVENVIEPFRDDSVPIYDVLNAMAEFHPTRTQQLAEAIVEQSLTAFPDEWVKTLTGMDLTVDQLKQLAAQGGSSPSNTAPPLAPVEDPEIEALINELDEVYGTSWKDPSKDGEILDADKAVVAAVRSSLAQNSALEALKQELEETKSQLGQIKPQVDNLATSQQAEIEMAIHTVFAQEVDGYRAKVEQNSFPKILEAKGLVAKDTDLPEIKAVKEYINGRFQPVDGYGSEFDGFLEKQFSGRESMAKSMQRVANNLIEASKLEVLAKKASDPQESQANMLKAQAFKEQALAEQDALTVWTRKAATEFLESSALKPVLELLEQNTDLRRKLNASGRPEIIGQTAALGESTGLKARLQEAKQQGTNPFDLDISDLLSGR
jgi:hypothetical protein